MKYLSTLALTLLSSGVYAGVDCTARPSHPQCSSNTSSATAGLPRVINGDGIEIGQAYSIGHVPYMVNGFPRKLMYAEVVAETNNVRYPIRFYANNTVSPSDFGMSFDRVYWDQPGCIGFPNYIPGGYYSSPIALTPIFTSDYFVMTHKTHFYSRDENSLAKFHYPYLAKVDGVRMQRTVYSLTPEPEPGQDAVCRLKTGEQDVVPISGWIDLQYEFSAPITFE